MHQEASAHQVGGDELAGEALPQGPAVGKIGDGGPQGDVVAERVAPPREGEVDELDERRVGVVVDGVAVDVSKHLPGPQWHDAKKRAKKEE